MADEIDRFIKIVSRLREPGGCPWDREQTHKSLLPCLIEESYEFLEAVDENDPAKMKEELGDLLLQVILHAKIASESGLFNINDVAYDICEKIIRRHPHVFGDVIADTPEEVLKNWEKIKKDEKKESRQSIIDGIPTSLPALLRADNIQRRVARAGFDWDDIKPVLDKVEEEFREFREALLSGDQTHADEELGDILFALVNVARHNGICAENALRRTIDKFSRRFKYVEEHYRKNGKRMQDATLAEMDIIWEESKEKGL